MHPRTIALPQGKAARNVGLPLYASSPYLHREWLKWINQRARRGYLQAPESPPPGTPHPLPPAQAREFGRSYDYVDGGWVPHEWWISLYLCNLLAHPRPRTALELMPLWQTVCLVSIAFRRLFDADHVVGWGWDLYPDGPPEMEYVGVVVYPA